MLAWARSLTKWCAAADFRTILACRRDAHQQESPSSGLLALPPELLEYIVDLLSPSEAACLSLSSRKLCMQFGTPQRWDLLRIGQGHEDERKLFLFQLTRHEPRWFFCHTCVHLHPTADVEPPLLGYSYLWRQYPHLRRPRCREWPPPFSTRCPFDVYDGGSAYRPSFHHVQLALARHRDGSPYGIDLDLLAITLIQSAWQEQKIWTLVNVEPQIVNGELLLRVQQWLVFSKDEPPRLRWGGGPSICRHITPYSTSLVWGVPELVERSEAPTCAALQRCLQCEVEFEVHARQLRDGRKAVVISKWLSLGSGLSPSDSKWQGHRKHDVLWRDCVATGPNEVSLRACFEEAPGRSQQAAIDGNATLLLRRSFRGDREISTVMSADGRIRYK